MKGWSVGPEHDWLQAPIVSRPSVGRELLGRATLSMRVWVNESASDMGEWTEAVDGRIQCIKVVCRDSALDLHLRGSLFKLVSISM